MIRFRVPLLLLSIASCHLIAGEDVSKVAEDKSTDTFNTSKKNPHQDLVPAASEFSRANYLPPSNSFRGRSCYDCNNEPWVPIIGRSLNFPISGHSNTIDNTHFRGDSNNKQFNTHSPPIDHYGAPQGNFNFPTTGEVVDFMLPPPIRTGEILAGTYGPPKPQYGSPQFSGAQHKPFRPLPNYGPPRSRPTQNYGPPLSSSYLRPVSQDISPPLPPINQLPLDNHMPAPVPSDSYGRPVTDGRLIPPPASGNSYGGPGSSYLPPDGYNGQHGYADPISLGSEDSENYGNRIVPNHFLNLESRFNQKGLTDVQVVPSVRVADYTASIEHPINLIQSPILDLNINNHEGDHNTLKDHPIIVDDSYTSASDVNSTFATSDSATAFKRDNDEFLSTGSSTKDDGKSSDEALTDNLIQKLLQEQNIIKDPSSQILDIKKRVVDSKKIHWTHPLSTKLTPVTAKNSKKLQIIVPYSKSTDFPQWGSRPKAIYNKEYTTLTPVFIPPAMTTEAGSLWTKLVEDLVTADIKKKPAQGFAKSETTTKVYNIHDYIAKQSYDMTSLQKNIDDWTHQSYANQYHFGEKLTTQLAHAKQIPTNFFSSTSSYIHDKPVELDNTASGSDRQVYHEITDNLITPDETTTPPKSTKPSIRFIVNKPKPTWESTKVTLSNSTHEKVYVVTPQSYTKVMTSTPATAFSMAPKVQNGKVNKESSMTRISVRVEAPKEKKKEKDQQPVKVVYINDLVTTTTVRSTTRHPLFGLMDLAPFTASPNATVETISGYSKA